MTLFLVHAFHLVRNFRVLIMIHMSLVPRSCDRCYTSKERCIWAPGSLTCERCARIGHACRSKRPIKRVGRPPGGYLSSSMKRTKLGTQKSDMSAKRNKNTATTVTTTTTLAPAMVEGSIGQTLLSTIEGLGQPELDLLNRTIHQDDFTEQFVIGPSFYHGHRQKLVFHLLSSRRIVLDAYLAFALSCGDQAQVNTSYKKAASALFTLRSIQIKDHLDITSCLMLGWQLLHFVFQLGGREILQVCSQTLSLLKPHYAAGKHFETSHLSFLTSIVLTETAECLMMTKLPTLKLQHAEASSQIDGCVGLCTGLLLHLYDLAAINVDMQHRSRQGQYKAKGLPDLRTRLEGVRLKIRDWKPQLQTKIFTKFTALEVAHMLCQHQIMQTAALLIIHRLQHRFGKEDGTASALASTILSQIDLTVHVTGKSPLCVDLPLIVACLEVEDDSAREQRLRSLSAIGRHSAVFCDRIKSMVMQVWTARRQGRIVFWHDIGHLLSRFL